MDEQVRAIERWFQRSCDGRWEHDFGLKIETTDNPGWVASCDVPADRAETLRRRVLPLAMQLRVQVELRPHGWSGVGGTSGAVTRQLDVYADSAGGLTRLLAVLGEVLEGEPLAPTT